MQTEIAVFVENKQQFDCVMSYMADKGFKHMNGNETSAYTWDPPHPGNCITIHDRFFIYRDSDEIIQGYTVLNFDSFQFLTGVELPAAPKQVLISWNGSFVNIQVDVKADNVIFNFSKGLHTMALSRNQINEVFTALKSLDNE